MDKTVTIPQLSSIVTRMRKNKKTTVVAGGCFDVLHIGHIRFLQSAKQKGDVLMVLLESDASVARLKGDNRPYFAQKERAEVLAAIEYVDFVVMLPPMHTDEEYRTLVASLTPSIIAITENDPYKKVKEDHAEAVGATVYAVPFVKTFSTSRVAKIIGLE